MIRKQRKKKKSGLGIGLALPKGKKLEGLTDRERDKRFKKLMAIICIVAFDDIENSTKYKLLMNLDLEHIKNKGSHPELRFDLDNAQFMDRKQHTHKTNADTKEEQREDIRTDKVKAFIESINYNE